MTDHSRAVQALYRKKFGSIGLDSAWPSGAEIEQVLRDTMPQNEMEFTERESSAIAVMSKTLDVTPQKVVKMAVAAYQLVVNGKHELREINPEPKMANSALPESPLRERLAELVKFAHDHHLEHISTADVADLLKEKS
jgi:hypothetical protein